MPKAKFQLLSISPKNQVPSCADCNKGKSAEIATSKSEQCLHPYFNQGHFISDQWLFAEVINSSPATIRYFVQAPDHWSATDQARINSHFDDFKLARRFSIQAGDEISNLRGELDIEFQKNQQAGVKQARLKKHAGHRCNILTVGRPQCIKH